MTRRNLLSSTLLPWFCWFIAGCVQSAPSVARPTAKEAASTSQDRASTDRDDTADVTVAAASRSEAEIDGSSQEEPTPQVPELPPVNCQSGPELGALALTPDEAENRHGSGQHSLSRLASSRARPVEVCGPAGQYTYLLETTCADGSRPFTSTQEVARARAGSAGPGGRCGKVVDLYQVQCPENRYEVYMDMYFCGPGETFMP